MENFLYPIKQTNFILCFDKVDDNEKVYGSLYNLLKNSVKVVDIG